MMRRPLKQLSTFLAAVMLASCGWHLRGWQSPSQVIDIQLQAVDRYAPLTLALYDAMQQREISDRRDAKIKLFLGNEVLHKRTVAVTSIGSPSQYEMSLAVEYRYWSSEAASKTTSTATVIRAFDFNPSNTVAKTQEENTLLEEMRRELAHRILHKIPTD